MRQTKSRYTTTDLVTIFHVGRTALGNHLRHNGLNKKLEAKGHIQRTKYRIYYDDVALISIARTFTLRGLSHVSHKDFNPNQSKQTRANQRELKEINHKLDLILNKLGLSY